MDSKSNFFNSPNSQIQPSNASCRWFVLPLHSMRNGVCSCGNRDCKSPAKHPRTPNGEKDATIDPARIKEWWAKWPDANLGVATGPSNLIVIDIDGEEGER